MGRNRPDLFVRLFRNSLLLALLPLTVLTVIGVSTLNAIIGDLARPNSPLLADPEQYVGGLRVVLGVLFLWLASAVAALAYFLSRLATNPLAELSQVLRDVLGGDHSRRAPIQPRDEVGDLGQAVNEVLDELTELRSDVVDQVERLEVLDEVALSIASLHPLAETLGLIAGAVPRLVGASVTVIALKKPDGSLDFHGGESSAEARVTVEQLARRILRLGPSVNGQVVNGQVVNGDLPPCQRQGWSGPAIAVPLQGRSDALGILWAGFDALRPAGSDEIRVLELLAAHAAIAVENVRMFEEVGRMEAIRHLNTAKQEFIAQVSHELRTPLSLVRGYAELLTAREVPLPEAGRMIAEIHEASCRMSRIVDDLLDVSRIESGQLSLHKTEMDVEEAVETALRTFRGGLGGVRRVEVCLRQVHPVLADRERVVQVLLNLLNNAALYSPADRPIRISTCLDGRQLRLSVADQGVGIAPDEQTRVFDKFYRVESDLKHRVKGTGLGLAICKTIVDAHGGRIWVESQPGRGSTFHFTLPLADIPAGILA